MIYQILGTIKLITVQPSNFLVISLDFSNDNSNLFNFMNDSYIHSNSDEYTQMLTSLLKHSFDTFTNSENLHFNIH